MNARNPACCADELVVNISGCKFSGQNTACDLEQGLKVWIRFASAGYGGSIILYELGGSCRLWMQVGSHLQRWRNAMLTRDMVVRLPLNLVEKEVIAKELTLSTQDIG